MLLIGFSWQFIHLARMLCLQSLRKRCCWLHGTCGRAVHVRHRDLSLDLSSERASRRPRGHRPTCQTSIPGLLKVVCQSGRVLHCGFNSAPHLSPGPLTMDSGRKWSANHGGRCHWNPPGLLPKHPTPGTHASPPEITAPGMDFYNLTESKAVGAMNALPPMIFQPPSRGAVCEGSTETPRV